MTDRLSAGSGRGRTAIKKDHLRLVFTIGILALVTPLVWGEPIVRYHGFKMNPQYRLVIEEENGLIRIGLLSRTRDVGGPHLGKATTMPMIEPNPFRSAKKEILIEVRAEALQPAAPNPLNNPAQRYRITIRGVDWEKNYATVIETGAATAREKFYKEMDKLEARAHGIRREALHAAAALTLGVLSQAGLMPAAVSETVKRSAVGQARGLGQDLQRNSMNTGRSLDPMATQKSPPSPGYPVNPAAPPVRMGQWK